MPDVNQLIELIKKISKTKDKVHLDVDYNGSEFFYVMPIRNIKASEWTPREPRKHE